MKKNKAFGIISLSLATLCVGGTFAAYTITDKANSIGAKITIDAPTKEAGYYLRWNDSEEIKLGDKVDTELKATVNVETTGTQTFTIVDENDVEVSGGSGTLTLDILGDYSFCFSNGSTYENGPSEHTYVYYSFYFTDTNNWGQSNIKCYLWNGNVNNGEFPGERDFSVEKVKDDDGYGHKVYKVTPNAYLYGSSGSKMVLSNGSGDKTIDIDICGAIAETNKKGIYLDNQSAKLTFDTSALQSFNWKDAGARAYAYVFDDNNPSVGNKWVRMTIDSSNDKLFVSDPIDITKYKQVIFVRLNSSSSIGWDAKWNQTCNLNIPSYVSSTISIKNETDGSGNYKCGDWYNSLNGISIYDYVA